MKGVYYERWSKRMMSSDDDDSEPESPSQSHWHAKWLIEVAVAVEFYAMSSSGVRSDLEAAFVWSSGLASAQPYL